MLLYSLIIFIVSIIIIFGYDLYIHYRNIINRRYLEGRITNAKQWEAKLVNRNSTWLHNVPKVPVSDNRRLIVFDIIRGIYSKKSIQSWQKGALYLSLIEHNKTSPTSSMVDTIVDDINAVDYGLLCFALLKNHVNVPDLYEKMISHIESCTTEDGIVLYRKAAKNIAFVDTIGFVCPFLSLYGQRYDRPDLIDLSVGQLLWFYENGFDQHAKLPFHAIQISSRSPMGICDWARGLAWYIIGLQYVSEIIDNNHTYFKDINRIRIELSDKLLALQLPNGGYSWQLNSKLNTDSSATAVFAWFLAKSYTTLHEECYLASARRCRTFLMELTTRSGKVDFCQGDTKGIGIYSTQFEFMPFANGFSLLLQKELSKYEN